MEAMRQSWTDERLDDFRGETAQRFDRLERRVDNGFNRVDAEFRELRGEMNGRFEAMQDRLEAMHRMLFRFCVLAMTALLGTLATVFTQL
jgi:hypothetical protein